MSEACPDRSIPPPVPCELSYINEGLSPFKMTAILCDHLRRHFSNPDAIRSPSLKDLIWRDGPSSVIQIEPKGKWNPATSNRRPAIVLKQNACRSVELCLNDLAGENTGAGTTDYVLMWVGSNTLFCVNYNDASSVLLAEEVQDEFTIYAPIFRSEFRLAKFSVIEIGEAGQIAQSLEHYATPVTVGWAYAMTWRITEEALPLRRVISAIVTL